MTKTEYKQLEFLLAKLGDEFGTHQFGIVTGWLQDGYHITTFDRHTGLSDLAYGDSSIELAVLKIINKKRQTLSPKTS